ncbi:MAG: DUF2784 domain-containing protein [Verrucomicrobiae bacterium]|nr:DUF2784 domain-containing protein [Verrucomicrobiae bacterium]
MIHQGYLRAADLVLLLHASFVAFVVGGWLLVSLGGWLKWDWVRRPLFRGAHLVAIAFVTVQAALGRVCPLTTLENFLRDRAGTEPTYPDTFIRYWVGRCLFYEADPWVFTAAYLAFLALVIANLWLVPIRKAPRSPATPSPES